MNNEYFLVGFRTTIGKRGYKLIDKITAINIIKAEFLTLKRPPPLVPIPI